MFSLDMSYSIGPHVLQLPKVTCNPPDQGGLAIFPAMGFGEKKNQTGSSCFHSACRLLQPVRSSQGLWV